jgi:hypothetical protein
MEMIVSEDKKENLFACYNKHFRFLNRDFDEKLQTFVRYYKELENFECE